MKYILISLILGACGAPNMDPAFKEYVDQMVKDGTDRGVTFQPSNIVFSSEILNEEISKGEAGVCIKNAVRAFIIVNKDWWDHNIDSFRTTLVMHEEGHCVFNMQHFDNQIMNPSIKSGVVEQDVDEFFKTAKGK